MLRENIKTVRKSKGLSQQELAVKLNVVRQTISKWEQGLSVPDADMLIHLGDVEDDADYIEAIFECPTHIVGGNNDFFSRLPREEEFELEGHHIFITHGHAYYVSMGEAHLQEEARRRGADIVMYGHTHVPALTIDADLVTLNPGSLTYPRQQGRQATYMVMKLEKGKQPEVELKTV